MTAERADDGRDTAQLAVRDRDAVANRSRTQPLALRQHCVEVGELDLFVLFGKRLGQFIQDVGLGGALQVANDHVGAQDVGNFHLVVQVESKITNRIGEVV